MDLPDTDKSNKRDKENNWLHLQTKMIQNEKKNWPKKFFFWKIKISIISTHYSTKYTKNKEKLMNRFFTKSKKPYFWAQIGPKKFLFEKIFFSQLEHFNSTSLYKKSGKNNEQIFHKVQKTLFLGIFGPKLAQKFFFWKSGSVTFWALPFCTFVPKIRKN